MILQLLLVKKGILGKLPSHVYSLEEKTWSKLKNKTNKTKSNRFTSFLQITVIVIFIFASMHFMHQDRITSQILRKDNRHSKTKELNKHDILSVSGMKDVSTETGTCASLYSFNEIFLLS